METVEELTDRSADNLLEPYPLSEPDEDAAATEHVTSTAALLSRLFLADDGSSFALVQAGRWLFVTDESRWAEGRYLGVALQTVAARNDTRRGGEVDRALTCVEAASLAPDADGDIWWSDVLADSVKTPSESARTCAKAYAARSRSSPTTWWLGDLTSGWIRCHLSRPSRWPSRRCGSSTASCSCSMPRPLPSWAYCRSRARVRARLQP
jgi:hypothetical protein